MRAILLISVVASLAVYVAAAPKAEVLSYNRYKVFRINTHGRPSVVQEKLSSLSFEQWNQDVNNHIDIAISPDQLAAFELLNLDFHVMHEDLGESIIAESGSSLKWKRQADDLAWYDTYHSYEDHIKYFEDLNGLFPNNSEIVSSGTSFEGRDIYGLHLWGGEGPGKPAVLYHGTVHAREWIAAPVCIKTITQPRISQT